MWEDQIADIVDSLKKKLLDKNEQVKYRKIVEEKELPQYIRSLFKNKVKYFFQKESPLEFKSTPHFKLNSDDIKEYRDKLVNIFWEGAIFSRTEVEDILKEALILRLNYLVKPIDTIRRMLFDDRDNISLENMDQMLTSFKSILPYAEIIIRECSKQGKSMVDKNIFSNIATEQLQNIFKENVVDKVLKDFSVFIEFLSATKGEKIEDIDGKTLQEFFADRNLWGFRRALEVEMKINGNVFSAENLKVVLKRYMELKNEFETSGEEKELQEKEPSLTAEEEKQELDTEEEIQKEEMEQEEKISETLDWELDEDTEESIEEKQEETKEEKEAKPKEKKKNKSMRIIRRDDDSKRDTDEENVEEKLERETEELDLGLRDLIDPKMEKSFIKKLFDNNSKTYENLIEKLNKAESWREAKVLIDNELFKRDIDPFSREAIKLVDLVYGVFYPEEGVGGK